MTLLALTVIDGGVPKDVVVEVEGSSDMALLHQALAPSLSTPLAGKSLYLERTGRLLRPGETFGDHGLRHADRIVVLPASAPLPSWLSATFELIAVEGVAAGTIWPLTDGTIRIGREAGSAEIALAGDVACSRSHCSVTIHGDSLTVADLDSTNGTFVNGTAITGPTAVGPGARIEVGESVFVVGARGQVPSHVRYDDGTLSFNRQPRVTFAAVELALDLPAPPSTPTKRRFPMAAAVLPVLMGGAMFVMTGQPYTLLMIALAPMMAIWSFHDDRSSGRKQFAADSAAYLEQLEHSAAQATRARDAAQAQRRQLSPAPLVLVQRAVSIAPDLWERRLSDPDFLHLRVGSADQSSMVRATLRDGGDEGLRASAEAIVAGVGTDRDVPLVTPLRDIGVLGGTGSEQERTELLRSMLVQIATLHSPNDVAAAVISPGAAADLDWCKWLPHVSALTDPDLALATSAEQVAWLWSALRDLLTSRKRLSERMVGAQRSFVPHVVVMVQAPVDLRPSDVSEFLRDGPAHGFSFVWLDSELQLLPNECSAFVAMSPGSVTVTDARTGSLTTSARPDHMPRPVADLVARSIGALRDASQARNSGGVPKMAPLLELLDLQPPTASALEARWAGSTADVRAMIGMGSSGAVYLDLAKDGPHGFAGGTTGSGKSGFLRGLIGSLAASNAPDRLNFVFVDYKASPQFEVCNRLPHAVGLVTNLDSASAERALVSLTAELERRQVILRDAGAESLADMFRTHPQETPPRLLIVVDEFQRMKVAVPAFVDGIVDIAARGRNVGMHLLLATQRPQGVITPDIEANTNYRIALRMANEEESRGVIGTDDAAHLPAQPGRGYLKVGQRMTEFQSVFVDGVSEAANATSASSHTFVLDRPLRQQAEGGGGDGPVDGTDLHALVDAATSAAASGSYRPNHRPWLPPLPATVSLRSIVDRRTDPSPFVLPIGAADRPDAQRQEVYQLDLAATGSLLASGAPGGGKTTLLRTIAAAAAMVASPDEIAIYCADAGGGELGALEFLPHCGGVATVSDPDRLRSLLQLLHTTVLERQAMFASIGAGSISQYRASTGRSLPDILFLIDDISALWSTLDGMDHGKLLDPFIRTLSGARGVGLHAIITADRLNAAPLPIASSIEQRFVMRLANPENYREVRLNKLLDTYVADGRMFNGDGVEIQIAALDHDGAFAGVDQRAALQELGQDLGGRHSSAAPRSVTVLPESIPAAEVVARTQFVGALLGIEESAHAAVGTNFSDSPTFFVAGPSKSGRTTALLTLASTLHAGFPDLEMHLIGARRTALSGALPWMTEAIGLDKATESAAALAARADANATGGGSGFIVVIDDADEFHEGPVATHLELLQRRARDAEVGLLISALAFKVPTIFHAWIRGVRANRSGVLLQPDLDRDGDIFNLRLPARSKLFLPPGRGFLISRGEPVLVQVALPDAAVVPR